MSMVLLALPPPDHLLIERDRGQFVPSRRRRMMANVRAERLLKIPAEPSPRDCSRASRPWWSSASWVGSAPSTPEQRERRKNTRARPHRRALTNSATASQGLPPSSRGAIARRQALSLHGSTIISLPSVQFTGTRQFKSSNRWTLFQQYPPMKIDGLDHDVDDLNPAFTDFGAFHQLDSLPVISPHLVVKARGGLRLRAGPGTEFDVQNVLPFGTEVSVVSRTGDFAAIDLNGDGAIDGFVFAGLLGEA